MVRFADDRTRLRGFWRPLDRHTRVVGRLEVAARFVGASSLAAMGHEVQAYTNDGTVLHLGASVSRLLFLYGAERHSAG